MGPSGHQMPEAPNTAQGAGLRASKLHFKGRGPPPTTLSVLGCCLVPPRHIQLRPHSRATVLLRPVSQAAGSPALTPAGPTVGSGPAGRPHSKARAAWKDPAVELPVIRGTGGIYRAPPTAGSP
ncbi:hypothetical protein NDU88_006844 [Pleurodeles waltl]|uniref:Uncharacterized protein n=1 Tax=Pleurodeles waltl TaxID=8319 RepID=A0AAV7UM81_PLEWA|nr:hypothetical protein NDU88_006844 [Pleurodeles waltl]